VCVAVDDQAVTVSGDAFVACQITRHSDHMADQRCVFVGDVVGGGDGFIRHDQDMHRRARVDVAKGRDLRVAVHDVSRQLTGDDAFE
jgi:hypothetical protein